MSLSLASCSSDLPSGRAPRASAVRPPLAGGVPGVPTTLDRTRLAERLDATRRRLMAMGRMLGPAQWTARESPARWTAAELVEHLALTEWTVLAFIRGPLLTGAPQGIAAGMPRVSDDALWRAVASPEERLAAHERLRPTGRWPRPAAQLAAFDAERTATLAYLRTTADPLRAVAAPHPVYGVLDGCQWLLYLAAHTERHLWQLAALARAAAA